jgi:hypothetical protein
MSTTVHVQFTGTGFEWGFTTGSMVPLSVTLVKRSKEPITFMFVRSGSSAIYYKLPPSDPTGRELPTNDGPTTIVDPDDSASISFSTSASGTYYTGSITVSSDDLLGGGNS